MDEQNLAEIEKKVEKKYRQKEKRKRPKMKVSGGRVRDLARIIKENK